MAYDYKIGANVGALVTLQSINVRTPLDEFNLFAKETELSGGNVIGLGFPVCTWHWTIISATEYAVLRTYCTSPNLSGPIAIRTYDQENAYQNYLGIIRIPQHKNFTVERLLDFTILFTRLVKQ